MKITTSFESQNCNLVHLFLVEFRYIFSFLEDTFITSYICYLASTNHAQNIKKIKIKNPIKQKIIKREMICLEHFYNKS